MIYVFQLEKICPKKSFQTSWSRLPKIFDSCGVGSPRLPAIFDSAGVGVGSPTPKTGVGVVTLQKTQEQQKKIKRKRNQSLNLNQNMARFYDQRDSYDTWNQEPYVAELFL